MCGLVFRFDAEQSAGALRGHGTAALRRLTHRGPDEKGIQPGNGWVIGHQRLSILDLSASCQPMTDPQSRFWLSFNGEIYNYHELHKALEGRWEFRTNGDTEVLLAGLVLDGPAFLSRMLGMWAFALWDSRDETLLLGRDRVGKKPLYYSDTGNTLSCASELPALHALCGRAWQEDPASTADYFRFGYYLPGTTAYLSVREILPGHYATWSPVTGLRERRYWQLSIGGFSGTDAQAKSTLREVLAEAIRCRMVADVEVGAFLSGGIDSSLIVALLGSEFGIKPKTFSIGFSEAAYDERRWAQKIARQWKTEHFEDCVSEWHRERLVTLITDHVGQPFYDASLLPTAMVSELAAQHVKVALSGDGGDEVFSGYQRYLARTLLRWYTRIPAPLRGHAETALRKLPEPMAHHSRSLLKKAHLFVDIAARNKSETPYTAPVLYSAEDLERLVPDLRHAGHRAPALPDACEVGDIQAMMAGDLMVYLPQDILAKVDRASMAHSLEVRAPFLDHRVIALAFSLPGHWHRRGVRGKRMLRSTFRELLPAGIWKRRKQGFAVPLHEWFRTNLGKELEQLVQSTDSPLDSTVVRKLLEAHRMRQRDHGYRLWNIYIYLFWHTHSQWQHS
jgi:asparagine synthase (glutamine-hydrolysing)